MAAAIAGLLTLIVQTVKSSRGILNDLDRADHKIIVFIEELESLSVNLTCVRNSLLKEPDASKKFSQASLLMSRVKKLEKKLLANRHQLETTRSSQLRKLAWPIKHREYTKVLDEIRNFSQWLQLCLSLDSSSLLSRSSEEIVATLTAQLQAVQKLEDISARATSIETRISQNTEIVQGIQYENEHKKILAWLPSEYQESKHRAIQECRVHGTGEWLLQTSAWQKWYAAESRSILWCYGPRGSGKSVLM